jgi:CelD/BcsL family acetyltransferase involved in cellulose biosynthesis
VALGPTVSLDLSASEEAARAGYSDALRRQIRNFRRAGLRTTHDAEWTHLATFARLYRETMVRNSAADYYLFTSADFERLRAALSGHAHLLVTQLGDVVGAAGLFMEFEGIVNVHLVATNQELASVSPYKVLVDDAVTWAMERGNTILHLGGGRGAREDSLFEFKRRFSPRRHSFFVGRWVLDRRAYRDLLEARLSAIHDHALLDPAYFPAYRAPEIAAEEVSSPGPGS